MAWFRYSDDWNRKPEIRALDDATYRAFQCLIAAAEHFDRCGMVPDDYAMAVYPHVRRKLRGRVRDLADRGLVHLLDSADDYQPNCPTCQVRRTEAMTEVGTEAAQKHPLSATASARSSRTEVMVICIPSFFEVAMTPEAKREKRRKDAERQQRKRDRDKAAASRRDAEPPSRPPVPVPDPKLRINDHVIASKEREPPSTASPSTPSIGTADRDAVSELRRTLEERWPNPEHLEHVREIQRLAEQEPGDPMATLDVALDGFLADTSQQKYRHVPQGLLMHWNRYVAQHREQTEAAEKKRRAEAAERRHQEAKRQAEEQHAREVAERLRQRAQNGTDSSSGKPMADAVADAVAAIAKGGT